MKTGIKIGVDGDQITATWEDFKNLHDSPAGFGDTVGAAILNLLHNDPKAAKENNRADEAWKAFDAADDVNAEAKATLAAAENEAWAVLKRTLTSLKRISTM